VRGFASNFSLLTSHSSQPRLPLFKVGFFVYNSPMEKAPGSLAVLETCLYAEDLDAAEKFYRDVLGLEFLMREKGRHVFFRCKGSMLLIFNPERTRIDNPDGDPSEIPRHGAEGEGHIAFSAPASKLEDWKKRLGEAGVPIESEVEWPNGNISLYFRDPSGNSLEIAVPELWGLTDHEEPGRGTN